MRKSGFSHFDGSHRENFLASVLLLVMENDDAVMDVVARLVLDKLGIDAACQVTGLSREVRLARSEDGKYARADLCLDFGPSTDPFCAFIEVKTHESWDEDLVTSLLASCRLCGVEPWAYLRDIFCLLPRWPEHRLLELAPVAWSETRDRADVRALLDANPFRKLTLDARG